MSDKNFLRTSNETKNSFSEKETMSFTYVSLRAQKIATALYLVTGLMESSEPLRRTLRERALSFLSFMRSLSDNPIQNDHTISSAESLGNEILSLMDLSLRSGLVSDMNHSFVVSELKTLIEEVLRDAREAGAAGILRQTLAAEEQVPMLAPVLIKNAGVPLVPKRTLKVNRQERGAVFAGAVIKDIKDMVKDKQHSGGNGKERKEKIHAVIETKGNVTIKDIVSVVPEYSEKTIQRDLVEMVLSGEVKKRGERRWTVYFL